jgi:hypothetical protein
MRPVLLDRCPVLDEHETVRLVLALEDLEALAAVLGQGDVLALTEDREDFAFVPVSGLQRDDDLDAHDDLLASISHAERRCSAYICFSTF